MPQIPDGLSIFVAFLFGAIIGSFLNVVSFRLRTGLGIGGRSMCMSCGSSLSWRELVPILSFVLQKGRCSKCSARISPQYPIVEAVTGAIFAFITAELLTKGITIPHVLTAVFYAVSASLLVVITVYDLKHKIIPDGLSYSFAAIAFASIFVGGMGSSASVIHSGHIWTLLAGPILAAPFAILWFASRGRWLGLGDAKLVLGIGWLLGLSGGLSAVIIAFWMGAIIGVLWLVATTGRVKRGAEIPFGPFLALGAMLVLFSGIRVIDLGLLTSLLGI